MSISYFRFIWRSNHFLPFLDYYPPALHSNKLNPLYSEYFVPTLVEIAPVVWEKTKPSLKLPNVPFPLWLNLSQRYLYMCMLYCNLHFSSIYMLSTPKKITCYMYRYEGCLQSAVEEYSINIDDLYLPTRSNYMHA